ncbi:hypothetical protein Acor_36040 [Acrocarpospora corrugata]|uniref:Uncharacterized protein n=1 Tax=Acrocarpospora corrugata TaxID=35763 RepID=A0A5M3W008_9ACTN|nr:hypothetical protein Acor_36040 [Acrocarpospora corrugata]
MHFPDPGMSTKKQYGRILVNGDPDIWNVRAGRFNRILTVEAVTFFKYRTILARKACDLHEARRRWTRSHD